MSKQADREALQKAYQEKVDQIAHKPPVMKNIIWAFCVIGQFVQTTFKQDIGLTPKDATAATSIVMVFLGAFLTGLGVYDEIGKRAGAGLIVPITGFANSIVACAMEFKRDDSVIIGTSQEYHDLRREYADLVLIFCLIITGSY